MLINRCKSDMVHQLAQTNQIYTLTRFYITVMVRASLGTEGSATSLSIAFLRKSPGSMVMEPPLTMGPPMVNILLNRKPMKMLNSMPQEMPIRMHKKTTPLSLLHTTGERKRRLRKIQEHLSKLPH
jgi:hypothetical protein